MAYDHGIKNQDGPIENTVTKELLVSCKHGHSWYQSCLIQKKWRCFSKSNWVAVMIVNVTELEKENGELCMVHGNLNITMVCLRFS